jgi:Dipeptide/tripeptide permease
VVEAVTRGSFTADIKPSYEVEAISSDDDEKYPEPTEEEQQTLRKVSENLSILYFALCIVEFAERASYYGAQTVFSNFIEFPLPKGK